MSILIWQEVLRVLVGVETRRYNGKSQESRTTRLPPKRLVSPPKRLVFPLSENPILPSRRPLASTCEIKENPFFAFSLPARWCVGSHLVDSFLFQPWHETHVVILVT